jgi:hypothetical protein
MYCLGRTSPNQAFGDISDFIIITQTTNGDIHTFGCQRMRDS